VELNDDDDFCSFSCLLDYFVIGRVNGIEVNLENVNSSKNLFKS